MTQSSLSRVWRLDNSEADVRYIVIIVLCSLLAACPAAHRVYIHNRSDITLTTTYLRSSLDQVIIRPGKTKHFWAPYNMKHCFNLTIGNSTAAFHLPTSIWAESRSTRYGSRLDVYFEYGQLHFRYEDGRWVQLEEIADCREI